ncbi:MAG: hypothetical protein J0L95_13475 [Candidatus Accumulibacter sp.]|jgi:hypothetical protein|uniref:hypothetical protein n=1 Tax=Accumulibacter sp. TaxID=2053492 RepID=UPI001AD35675|nr:hypothetical protein [Accumulibacter sp.]MBN8439035.1 hypothetical protein [Accumulibacter sp.]
MNILNLLVQRTREVINRRRYERELAVILKTPPVVLGKDAFTALSMVHHRDVESYLLAIKSFCRFLHPRRIVMVADPSITDADRSRIASHVLGIEIVRAEDYRGPGMPQGGCWERLIAISEYVKTDYVIQIDADTVSLLPMPEVANAVAEASSFVLATEDGQHLISCSEAAQWAKVRAGSGEHIQVLAEANLDRLPRSEHARYVRGCAGFSGFARGCFSRSQLGEFSQTMSGILGDRWTAWGTEQFSSNFMVSNSPRASVLPHPKYCHPGREKPGTVFLHFIGYVRFVTDRYARAARETCVALGAD